MIFIYISLEPTKVGKMEKYNVGLDNNKTFDKYF